MGIRTGPQGSAVMETVKHGSGSVHAVATGEDARLSVHVQVQVALRELLELVVITTITTTKILRHDAGVCFG